MVLVMVLVMMITATLYQARRIVPRQWQVAVSLYCASGGGADKEASSRRTISSKHALTGGWKEPSW